MQYALIELQNKKLLVSANEMQSIHHYHDELIEQPKPDTDTCLYHIAYGCYMPQPGIEIAQVERDFQNSIGHWLRYVEFEKCHIIAFCDVQVLPLKRIGHSNRIPFAALIQADTSVIQAIGDKNSVQAVTAFLCYADLSPATNILNRPGIIAFKGIERRIKGSVISPANWRDHIDPKRIEMTVQRIK